MVSARSGRRNGNAGIRVWEKLNLSRVSLVARQHKVNELSEFVALVFGVALPAVPRIASADGIAFIWAGIDRWLIETEKDLSRASHNARLSALGEFAALCDQGDSGRTIDIEGPRVREVLAKVLPIDLHPGHFRPGDVAVTTAAHMGVILWQTAAAPRYRIVVGRSYFASFWHGLQKSAAEFGCEAEISG